VVRIRVAAELEASVNFVVVNRAPIEVEITVAACVRVAIDVQSCSLGKVQPTT